MIGHDAAERQRGKGSRRSNSGASRWVLVLVAACLPVSAATAKYGGGSGTVQAPYLIGSAEDFQAIGNNPGDWGKCFKLTQDLDLSAYHEGNLQMIGRWSALGSGGNQPFSGQFDGNGKTIANFTYRNMAADYVGLFQHVTGDIKNLRLLRPKVTGNKQGTGALVGYLEKNSVLNCSAERADVSGYYGVGGLVGCMDGGVQQCWSDGVVAGGQYVGGLIGQVGRGTVASCFSRVRVRGNESVGGLVGATLSADAIVNSCYARGAVDGGLYAGGLVGQVSAGRVFRCYSAGKVTATQYPGGLVGYGRAQADVTGCLWDTESSTQAKSAGGTGKTTAEMKRQVTFVAQNWDFGYDCTWLIWDGIGYPVLTWQVPPMDWYPPDGVDFVDFAWFAAQWGNPDCGAINGNCEGADFDQSGVVDFRDLAVFAENWLAGL